MIEEMENWLIADTIALSQFYGTGFQVSAIPTNLNVEQISKQQVTDCLNHATRDTAKGSYHKIHHGPKNLAQLDVAKVRKASAYCDRLFTTLANKMEITI
jgi:hypothetical protein